MKIHFQVGSTPATLTRDSFFGGMKIITAARSIWLQHPLNLFTHFSFQTKNAWEREIEGRIVRVEKTRSQIMGGLRAQNYTIYVDDQLVASDQGY